KMRPRPHQSAAALPSCSTSSAVSESPTTPRTPSVPKYCRATARDDSGLHGEHELAPDVSLAERAERILRLVELVRPVDRGPQLAPLEHVGEGLQVRLVELCDEERDRVLAPERRELDGRDVAEDAWAAVGADDHDPAVGLQRAPHGVPRVSASYVDDQVVPLVLACEVLAGVVEHAIGAERTRLLDVASAADGGHVRAEGLRDLDGEGSDAARGAVDEHALARLELAVIPDPLERGQSGDPHRRGLLEGDV